MSTLPRAHVGDQIFERLGLIHWIGVDRIGVENRLADVAQGLIDARGRRRERRAADDRQR